MTGRTSRWLCASLGRHPKPPTPKEKKKKKHKKENIFPINPPGASETPMKELFFDLLQIQPQDHQIRGRKKI